MKKCIIRLKLSYSIDDGADIHIAEADFSKDGENIGNSVCEYPWISRDSLLEMMGAYSALISVVRKHLRCETFQKGIE